MDGRRNNSTAAAVKNVRPERGAHFAGIVYSKINPSPNKLQHRARHLDVGVGDADGLCTTCIAQGSLP